MRNANTVTGKTPTTRAAGARRSWGIWAVAMAALGTAGCSDGGAGQDPGTTAPESLSPMFDSIGRTLGPISDQIVRLNQKADANLNLLVRLEVQDNELFEVYEPTPGSLLITGAGAPEGSSAATEPSSWNDLQAVQAWWNEVTGGLAMPPRLTAAVQRRLAGETESTNQVLETSDDPPEGADGHVHDTGSEPVADSESSAEDRVGQVQQAVHSGTGWCNTGFETFDTPGSPNWSNIGVCNSWGNAENVCWDHVTGPGYAQNPDCYKVRDAVCPYVGQITFKISTEDPFTDSSWTVPVNTVRWHKGEDSGCATDFFDDCPWVKAEVLNASGDWYNYRFHVTDEEF